MLKSSPYVHSIVHYIMDMFALFLKGGFLNLSAVARLLSDAWLRDYVWTTIESVDAMQMLCGSEEGNRNIFFARMRRFLGRRGAKTHWLLIRFVREGCGPRWGLLFRFSLNPPHLETNTKDLKRIKKV
jgi:hypothetical protein